MLIGIRVGLQEKHVTWLVDYILEEELPPIKHVLDECYALLAPVLPGDTLVLTTPRNERVKGTVTRVGTRIVKAVSTLPPSSSPSVLSAHARETLQTNPTDATTTTTRTCTSSSKPSRRKPSPSAQSPTSTCPNS